MGRDFNSQLFPVVGQTEAPIQLVVAIICQFFGGVPESEGSSEMLAPLAVPSGWPFSLLAPTPAPLPSLLAAPGACNPAAAHIPLLT